MSDDLSIDELIIDDSFANYCFGSNEDDTLFWQEFILTNPSQKEKIEEAKQIVLGLRVMLKQEHADNDEQQSFILKAITRPSHQLFTHKTVRYAAAAAAIFLLIFGVKNYLDQSNTTHGSVKNIAATTKTDAFVFATAKGEKKSFLLPDSTKIYLSAGSVLRTEEGFGINNRGVYLRGEALFEVTHNKALPFIVHIDKYDVKVLGTVFNVKAYPEDNVSETSLISGKVEISLKNKSQNITLKPNQKAVINNKKTDLAVEDNKQLSEQSGEKIVLLPLSYNRTDSVVIETAWAQNRLEIVNESFDEIKNKLERWYNVKIVFADEEVGRYTFTATFTRESIDQVLKALQFSYHFAYKTEGETITISK